MCRQAIVLFQLSTAHEVTNDCRFKASPYTNAHARSARIDKQSGHKSAVQEHHCPLQAEFRELPQGAPLRQAAVDVVQVLGDGPSREDAGLAVARKVILHRYVPGYAQGMLLPLAVQCRPAIFPTKCISVKVAN